METVRAGAASGPPQNRRFQVGTQSHRRLRGRRAKRAEADTAAGGSEGGPAPPGVSRPDRAFAYARGTAGLRGGHLDRRLRKGGGPAAGGPALRRTLGPALDGYLALQRLGRVERRQPDSRQIGRASCRERV